MTVEGMVAQRPGPAGVALARMRGDCDAGEMTPRLTPFSHDDLLAGVEALAQAIEADCWRPALLVGIGRGGLAPAVYLSHRTGLPLLSVDVSSGVPSFSEDLLEKLAERAGAGEKLLFVEDINDSGGTISAIRQRFASGEAPRFAVLVDNVRSIESVDYRFRTIDREVTKDWFVFPWESVAPRQAVIDEANAVPERLR